MNPVVTAGSYTISALSTLEDMEACFRLQEEVWGRGFREAAPVSILKVGLRLGGLVGGAVDASGELVGFVFGLTGLEDGAPVHWSHMLAVRPGLRDGGLGRRLKAWQRDRCREMGVERMSWTFDPLESRNAWLNLGRLGVVVREYVENMYGVSDSPLHRGVGTDRFVALWLLDDDRVENRLAGTGPPPPCWDEVRDLPRAFPVELGSGPPRPGDAGGSGSGDGDAVLVPIPCDIHGLKERDPELAADWREATRRALSSRLASGWEVRDLVRTADPVSYYLLRPVGAV